jgi:hypothetical protein
MAAGKVGCVADAAGDPAVEDDVAGGLVGGGAGLRGEEAGRVGVEYAAVEDGGGVAEDEVDASFNVRVDVVLAPVIGEERVLMPEEAAALEDGAVAADGDSDSRPVLPAVFSKVILSASKPGPLISTVSVKKVPPACLALSELVMTTSSGDLPMPIKVMLGWFCVTITRS